MTEDPIEILTFGPLLAPEPRATFEPTPEELATIKANRDAYEAKARARSEATRAMYRARVSQGEGGE